MIRNSRCLEMEALFKAVKKGHQEASKAVTTHKIHDDRIINLYSTQYAKKMARQYAIPRLLARSYA